LVLLINDENVIHISVLGKRSVHLWKKLYRWKEGKKMIYHTV
jgi:hypothetical protein